jgi:hypothetical protein
MNCGLKTEITVEKFAHGRLLEISTRLSALPVLEMTIAVSRVSMQNAKATTRNVLLTVPTKTAIPITSTNP